PGQSMPMATSGMMTPGQSMPMATSGMMTPGQSMPMSMPGGTEMPGDSGMGMSGMMSAEDMTALQNAQGVDASRLF
ncbi:DUF305 domain-containing protein, partial [Rhodococcus fascians]|nr:DUF305 domain-containing protein [Rhodococcus fascians]